MTLLERIQHTDRIQGRRYERLRGEALAIAYAGIQRHFNACDRHDVEPDTAAIREIIDDALQGRAVYAEKSSPQPLNQRPTSAPMLSRPWVLELLARESFTSQEAAELSGDSPHDIILRLRQGKGLALEAIGPEKPGRVPKRYRLRRTEDM